MDDNSGDSWLDSVSDWANAGIGAYKNLSGRPTAAAPAATGAAPAQTNWLLIGGIGAAVLVVLALVLSLGKK